MTEDATATKIVIDDAFIREWHPKYDLTENDESHGQHAMEFVKNEVVEGREVAMLLSPSSLSHASAFGAPDPLTKVPSWTARRIAELDRALPSQTTGTSPGLLADASYAVARGCQIVTWRLSSRGDAAVPQV